MFAFYCFFERFSVHRDLHFTDTLFPYTTRFQALGAAQVVGGVGAGTAGTAPSAAAARADQLPAGGAQAGTTFLGQGIGDQPRVAEGLGRLPSGAIEHAAGVRRTVGT